MTDEVAAKRLRRDLEAELVQIWERHGDKLSDAAVKRHIRETNRLGKAIFTLLDGRDPGFVQMLLFAMLRQLHHGSDDPKFRRAAQRAAIAHVRILARNEVERKGKAP